MEDRIMRARYKNNKLPCRTFNFISVPLDVDIILTSLNRDIGDKVASTCVLVNLVFGHAVGAWTQ